MKLAKATKEDIEAAMKLTGLLNTIDDGYYPADDDEDSDGDLIYFDPEDIKHLRTLYDKLTSIMAEAPGGWNRVIWGFGAIMDTELLDPNAETLEVNPRILKALEKDAG